MKRNVDELIAIELVRAQIASDSGKGIHFLPDDFAGWEARTGYARKEQHILNAIRLIASNRTRYLFWCEEAPDQNGYPSIITYFSYRGENGRMQISFHSPQRGDNPLRGWIGKGTRMHWNRKASRATAWDLYHYATQA